MTFLDLRAFIEELDRRGELARVSCEVDADREIAAIQRRATDAGGPALLFEQVKGSPYRLVSNLFGTPERVELAFGRPPAEIGEELAKAAEQLMPPSPRALWSNRRFLRRLLGARLKTVRSGPVEETSFAPPQLDRLPVLTCWPEDGGPFFTLPLVHTVDPETGAGNMGIYRLQRFDDASTGMHWQIEKGGGFHFAKATSRNESLPISVVLGGPPALTLAAIAPLPEGLDERLLAAFLLGRPLEVTKRPATGHRIAARAEFLLEGRVRPGDVRREGPFGDHLGHYSHAADFPVFRVERLLARRDAIYPATVVGKPPQEDFFIGNALQELFVPLLKATRPGVADLWAYAETGFHPLAVLAVRSRYEFEALKFAFGILGEGQLSLTKVLIVVDETVDVRDFRAVGRALREHFDPAEDLHVLAPTAQDTLDFTGPDLNLGSRMILLANRRRKEPLRPAPPPPPKPGDLHPDVLHVRALNEAVLMVRLADRRSIDAVREALALHPSANAYLLHVAVSEDVDLDLDHSALWGWFTRFDPLADLHATREIDGNRLRFRPPLFIDATWKPGYRRPVDPDPEVERRVERRWNRYGISRA